MTLENIVQRLMKRQGYQGRTYNKADHPGDNMLLKNYLIDYLKSIDGETRSRSYSMTLAMAIHIIDGIGDLRMNEINKTVLRKFINNFAKKKYLKSPKANKYEYYSQSEINKVYDLLHKVIKEASNEDGDKLLPIDYMANIKKPRTRQTPKSEPKAFTDQEINRLLRIVSENPMIQIWILIMLYTGARPSEVLALKWSDINYEEKTIDIFRTLSQEDFYDAEHMKKIKPSIPIITDLKNERNDGKINWQKRTLKVGDVLLTALMEWNKYITHNPRLMDMKRKHGTEEFLFCGPDGQMWLYEYYRQTYARLLKKHGLKYSDYNAYRFRHNYCTRLFRANINIKAAQMIMGDNTPTMVMKVYANLDKSDVLNGSEYLSKGIDKVLSAYPPIQSITSDILSE